MKKLFALLCAGLMLAMAATAFADVDVYTEVDKNWCADIYTKVCLEKAIYLGIKQLAPVDSSAQADVTKNDAIVGNIVLEIPTVTPGNDILEEPDIIGPVLPTALINANAFNMASGVTSVNQAPGNANNQGNAVALAYANDNPAFLNASVHVEKEIGTSDERLDPGIIAVIVDEFLRWDAIAMGSDGGYNPFANLGGTNIVVGVFTPRTNTITDTAFQYVTGVTGVNQSAGNLNNQDNAVALAVGGDPTACLAESDLGMVTANNVIAEIAVTKTDLITADAFSVATGVTSVNQSSGNCNNQANSVAVIVSGLSAIF